MPKRPAAARRAAATDASSDDKKQKRRVFIISAKIRGPPNVSPLPLKLDATTESKRAARQAKEKATSKKYYTKKGEFPEFAKPFEAALASAFAKEGGPVSLSHLITEMTNMTRCKPMFRAKSLKEKWCWDGFNEGRWDISRNVDGKGLVAFQKAPTMDKQFGHWRFSPSPAARPLADLSK